MIQFQGKEGPDRRQALFYRTLPTIVEGQKGGATYRIKKSSVSHSHIYGGCGQEKVSKSYWYHLSTIHTLDYLSK